ncbi:SUMF1/EgtB/PvdO family nonheme iron enzyme [Fibrobacter sp. UBA4297]|uniref:formylglycine-generating enzyme family protein n=1 Tax=Fibrobacter sp. UBA4297 TaxID=1946536 RepID=UPI0025C061BF|nr:SUMF1/EgtB/PvdO family nonheme iron enzyme [Fibrobacter sp. UBA4297]
MKKLLILTAACFALSNAQQYKIYDMNGKNLGTYNGEVSKQTLILFAKNNHGSVLVKKNNSKENKFYSTKTLKNLTLAQINQATQNIELSYDSLNEEKWIEVEKNEIVKICQSNRVFAWETSLNSRIINDSCLAFQAPTLNGVESISVYLSDSNSAQKINLAVGMKYLNFKNEEVLLGYNSYDEESLKLSRNCVTEKGTIDCTPQNEDPERIVKVTGTYLVDKYPITNCEFIQATWDNIPNKSPHLNLSIKNRHDEWISRKKNSIHNGKCDVHDTAASTVTLYQAIKYANARSNREGLKPYYTFAQTSTNKEDIQPNGYVILGLDFEWPSISNDEGFIQVSEDHSSNGYRLPYYDEWMMLARGGSKEVVSPWGDPSKDTTLTLDDMMKYGTFTTTKPHSEKEIHHSEPVGQKQPNGYGLYDMFGLVGEHVLMKYEIWSNFYNPSCRKGGEYRVKLEDDDYSLSTYWKHISFGHFRAGHWGAFDGFRLIRNIGNDAKWENIESGTK